jgi:hypothetical protein
MKDKVLDIAMQSFSIFNWFCISLIDVFDSTTNAEPSSQIAADDCPYPVATLVNQVRK